jgi:hypothetical protein
MLFTRIYSEKYNWLREFKTEIDDNEVIIQLLLSEAGLNDKDDEALRNILRNEDMRDYTECSVHEIIDKHRVN